MFASCTAVKMGWARLSIFTRRAEGFTFPDAAEARSYPRPGVQAAAKRSDRKDAPGVAASDRYPSLHAIPKPSLRKSTVRKPAISSPPGATFSWEALDQEAPEYGAAAHPWDVGFALRGTFARMPYSSESSHFGPPVTRSGGKLPREPDQVPDRQSPDMITSPLRVNFIVDCGNAGSCG